LGIRRFCRLAGCVAALAALSAMTVPSIAGATPKVKYTYLSLGDSLAFGYSAHAFYENEATGDPVSAFEKGFASDYFAKINTGGKIQFVNDGCPGETSESLIGNSATLLSELNGAVQGKVPEPVTGEAPCAYQAAGLPLHHPYVGKSQLESALETIATAKAAGRPVKGITIDIGANDTLHVVAKIEKEVEARQERIVATKAKKAGEDAIDELAEAEAARKVGVFLYTKAEETCETDDPGNGPAFCASTSPYEKPPAMSGEFYTYAEVFEGQYKAAHEGEVVEKYDEYLTKFLPENIGADHVYATHECEVIAEGLYGPGAGPLYGPAVCASEYMNDHITVEYALEGGYLEAYAEGVGEAFAANYLAVHGAELAKEGHEVATTAIETAAPALFEQIETNEVGILSALRSADPHAKIIFVGTYNPYGRVGGLVAGHEELQPGFNALLAKLNASEALTLKKHPLKACFVNEENLFNPASVSNTLANEELEEVQLDEWLNMANPGTTQVPDEATLTSGSAEITAVAEPFLEKGNTVTATNLPAGTTVVSVNNVTKTAVLSKKATGSGTEAISIGKKDGGDIHATTLGYEEMAGQIEKTCTF